MLPTTQCATNRRTVGTDDVKRLARDDAPCDGISAVPADNLVHLVVHAVLHRIVIGCPCLLQADREAHATCIHISIELQAHQSCVTYAFADIPKLHAQEIIRTDSVYETNRALKRRSLNVV